MRESTKYILIYFSALFLLVIMAIGLAQAQETQDIVSVEAVEGLSDSEETSTLSSAPAEGDVIELNQAELDQMLAPIALYPDSLLSQILVASTYPLEVIQASRWREQNEDMTEEEALQAVENKEWDPSVKALAPFKDLLTKLSDDLDWLQQLGDAFLANEEQVLASVQTLRQKAYEHGSLSNNEYIEVVEEDDNIIIEPVEKEIVYVPYYDTRTVYGSWWWHDYEPVYWRRPAHYYWHAGFYWSPRFYVRPSYFIGGFHWHRRHLVYNHHYYNRHGRYDDGVRRVRVTEYQRWNHNPVHRRGVRYHSRGTKSLYHHNKMRPVKVVRNTERTSKNKVRQVNAYGRDVSTKRINKQQAINATRTEQKLKNRKVASYNKPNSKRTQQVVQQHQARQQKVKNYSHNKARPENKPNRQVSNYSKPVKREQRQSRSVSTSPKRYSSQPSNRSKSVNRQPQRQSSPKRTVSRSSRSTHSSSSRSTNRSANRSSNNQSVQKKR